MGNYRSPKFSIFVFRPIGLLIAFILIVAVVAILSPGYNFIRRGNIEILLSIGSEFSIVVLGVGLLMIAGEFDLSIGSNLVLSSFIFIRLFELGLNPFIATFITLATGASIGLINSLITVKSRIPSFITTLGMMQLLRGLTLLLSGGATRPADLSGFIGFYNILIGYIGNLLRAQAIWLVLFALILGFLLHNHRFGNWIYATGDNKEAARAMGINTDRVKIMCFVIVGILCAFVAVMQIVRVRAFSSRAGDGWELRAIAAAVVGGTSLRGGIGGMPSIFIGALIVTVIENALILLRLPYEWTYMVYGLLIIISVSIDTFIEKRRVGFV